MEVTAGGPETHHSGGPWGAWGIDRLRLQSRPRLPHASQGSPAGSGPLSGGSSAHCPASFPQGTAAPQAVAEVCPADRLLDSRNLDLPLKVRVWALQVQGPGRGVERRRGWALGWGRPDAPSVFQIILVSSSLSDRDQSLFLSTDEGASFQKQLVPFSVETLLFHPRQEDKVLAYTREGKVSGPGDARELAFSTPGTQEPWAVGEDPGP